ncbi:MAG: DUF167 domain-containing protein [Acidimicrobiia bacterium]|nr:DUF167 domain-containing protein [Acidimicrobiia bacterium]
MTAGRVVRAHPSGAMVTVWVVPGARRTEVVGYHGDALRIRVAAPPERGRATRAVIDHLSDRLGIGLRLAGGAGSRRKRLVAPGLSVDELAERVDRLVD